MRDPSAVTTQATTISLRRYTFSRKWKDTGAAYTLVAPVTILFTVFYFWPLIQTIVYSFYQFNIISPTKQFVGVKNYSAILSNQDLSGALIHTVFYTVFTVGLSTGISLFIAVLLNQKLRGKVIYRTIYFLPVIAPQVATSIVFSDLFSNDNTGVVNHILSWFHIGPIAWIGDPKYAMITVIMYSVWTLVGYNMVIFLAGLQGIDQSYYEAARIDGAGTWSLFRNITLPLLGPTTLFVVVVGVLGAFQVFNQVYIMTQGGPLNATTTIVYYIYNEAFRNFNGGPACAMSVILFVILLVISVVQVRLFGSKR